MSTKFIFIDNKLAGVALSAISVVVLPTGVKEN